MREIISPLSGLRSPFGQPVDPYKVAGRRPPLVLDFDAERYRADGGGTTFSSAITHAATSNATMVDSDGLLKWRPHNFCLQSEDFGTDAGWAWTRSTVTENQIIAPDGSLTADYLEQESGNTSAGAVGRTVTISGSGTYTWAVFAKAAEKTHVRVQLTGSNYAYFDVESGTAGAAVGCTTSITDYGNGWHLCAISAALSSNPFALIYGTDSESLTVVGSGGIYLWGAHLYRSDLGGMVNNPDRGDSYVPTTSQKVFLPRRGHYVYSGSAWVNEGILHESEARTNLLTYSEDLSDAAWTKASGVTIGTPVTRNGISLDLIENAGGANFRNVTQSVGSVADGEYLTLSCFIEAGTSTETAIRVDDVVSGASSNRVSVPITWTSGIPSLQADVTLGLTFVDASLQDWEDGVYRVHLTVLNGTGGSLTLYPKYYIQWDDTAAAVNTYAGGFQAEIGSTPSSYIPTSGSTVERAAETLTIPAANMPWPTPNVIGSELVTNGTFDTDTSGWTLSNCTGSVSNGVATFTALAAGSAYVTQTFSMAGGKVYALNATFSGAIFNLYDGAVFTGYLVGFVSGVENIYYLSDTDGTVTATYFWTASGAGDSVTIDNVSVREIDPLAVSLQMEGRMTYADTGTSGEVSFYRQFNSSTEYLRANLRTDSTRTGAVQIMHMAGGTFDDVESGGGLYSPGVFVPFNIAARHGSTFVNGAVDGTALTANTTPVALPDLETTDLLLGYDYNGTIKRFRVWAADLGDENLETATS